MSVWLVAVVMIIYASVSVIEALHGSTGMSIMYAGYAFANVGLIIMGLSYGRL